MICAIHLHVVQGCSGMFDDTGGYVSMSYQSQWGEHKPKIISLVTGSSDGPALHRTHEIMPASARETSTFQMRPRHLVVVAERFESRLSAAAWLS